MSIAIARCDVWSTVIEEGVKIFPPTREVAAKKNEADSEADDFLLERDNGNLELAKYLGQRYARRLLRLWSPWDSKNERAQKKALFSYVVVKVEQKHSQSSILKQATLSAFYETVRKISKSDYEIISDSLAHTQYLLCENSAGEQNIGEVFAKLCGHPKNTALINRAEVYYHHFTAKCTELHHRTCYK